MNIVFISHLTNVISQGPNYSVPAQIKAQSKIDNVFWWNLTDALQNGWDMNPYFHGPDFPARRITDLPDPFSHPDLVIFESFYYLDDVLLARNCKHNHIPYIIIPRSALTKQGQRQKKIKKILGNILLFRHMCRSAAAIQYLTEKEKADSGDSWCKKSIVIPNGIETPNISEHCFHTNKVIITYIGRFDPYQKGLDLLLKAVNNIKNQLIEKNAVIHLYGPKRGNCREEYSEQIHALALDDVMMVKDGIFGSEKEKVLAESDLFISVSRFEGLPMSMLEALAYGLPCIASTGTNLSRVISSCDAGWECNTDISSISGAILMALDAKNHYSRMSRNAIKLAQQYDWRTIALDSENKYKAVIKG